MKHSMFLSFSTRRYTNDIAIELATKLTEICPGDLNRVLFTPGGTSSIGIALKIARYVTGRFKTISKNFKLFSITIEKMFPSFSSS